MFYWLAGFIAVSAVAVAVYLQHPKFGRMPEGERLVRIQHSPNYVDGEFRNTIDTPMLTEGQSFFKVLFDNITTKGERLRPVDEIPAIKTDLHGLNPDEDRLVWLGHSSFLLQLSGKRILIDPVFSEGAAPIAAFNRAYAGTNDYSADDMPMIDALLITHDHWDHLDYPSVLSLNAKVRRVIAPLGIGSYFEEWGYELGRLDEGDWFDHFDLGDGVSVYLIPARHYSGRMLTRRKTLWAGFVLETPQRRLLFSGDSGYGPHFAEIGRRFDGFDLVSLDSGQYDPRWAYIHMTPEQAVQAAEDLGAKALMPAHVGRFTLAKHPWDEPFERISEASAHRAYRLVTPMIGEPVDLASGLGNPFKPWWR